MPCHSCTIMYCAISKWCSINSCYITCMHLWTCGISFISSYGCEHVCHAFICHFCWNIVITNWVLDQLRIPIMDPILYKLLMKVNAWHSGRVRSMSSNPCGICWHVFEPTQWSKCLNIWTTQWSQTVVNKQFQAMLHVILIKTKRIVSFGNCCHFFPSWIKA